MAETVWEDWRPIDLAPRDGRLVLLSDEIGKMELGFFSPEPAPGAWFGQGGATSIFPQPLFWMPLPLPPERAGLAAVLERERDPAIG
jgi:hypothetical protein